MRKPSHTATSKKRVLILGIGNLLWADEGFGVRCVEHMHAVCDFSRCHAEVTLMDGGTQCIYLMHHIQQADALIVFDAVDYGLEPGTIKLVRDDEVPQFLGAKQMSLHQTGFQDVLAIAQLTGHYPREILLIGAQPQQLEEFGGGLTPIVKNCIEPAVEAALAFLVLRGIKPVLRRDAMESLVALPCSQDTTDDGGSEEPFSYRNGDTRFFPSRSFQRG